jgi:hypothetical protein
MKYPIFIASKGRYDPKQARTIKFLQKNNVPFYLCVEEEEAPKYLDLVESVHLYPPTGVGKARQYCLETARRMGFKAFWNLDDDITAFRHNGHPVEPLELFDMLELRFDEDNKTGIIGPQYSQVVWRMTGTEVVDGQCPCIVTLSRTNVPWDYDENLLIGEDLDWMFKFVLGGYHAIVDNHWTFDAQKSHRFDGKVGGISYDDEELDSSLTILEARYPGVITRDGNKFRRNWRRLRQMASAQANLRS